MKQFLMTPAAGKRLIGKGVTGLPAIKTALESGTVLIVAGTTNGYVAEEILHSIGQADGFSAKRFFRGITLPLGQPTTPTGRLPDESEFPGDVVIVKGEWQQGKTIFDVIDDLQEGDVILKGANALDLTHRRAAIYIGHPKAGTIGVALQAVVGRRVHLILPVGLEKRVPGDLDELAAKINAPGARGPRFFPVPGRAYTELDALTELTGATVDLLAGGGVCGAEGSVWLGITGQQPQVDAAEKLLRSLDTEPAFTLGRQ